MTVQTDATVQTSPPQQDSTRASFSCQQHFASTGQCPQDRCQDVCGGSGVARDAGAGGGCARGCGPLPCDRLALEHCEARGCVAVDNCAGERVCTAPLAPGGRSGCVGFGQLALGACCKQLQRRCGDVRIFDASCGKTLGMTPQQLPVCLSCGDGRCSPPENYCNCPEDCEQTSAP
ncbi:MAG: hypothetical protein KC503_17015 [Myxococcales bacterium]|nr:hypothetical protein [Myxococcales bacterium]